MGDTLSTIAGALRGYVPECPLATVYDMVKDAYRALINFPTDSWAFQFGQSQMICYQSIMGNCYAVQGSTTIQQVVADNGMASFTFAAAGSGNSVGDILYPIGYSGGQIVIDTVNGSGGALTGHISNAGANFQQASGITTYSSGSGTGTTINVTGLGNGVLPGDRTTIVGRQAMFGGQAPIYSIVDNQGQTTYVLDQPYGGVTGTVSFEITNIYWTPTDPNLERLMCLTDPPNGCQLPTSFTFEELNNIDPQRSQAGGTPYLLADVDMNVAYLAALPSGVTDSFGQSSGSQPVLRKEIYPRQQANYNYPYFYKKWIPDLTPANPNPIAYFSRRGDVIKKRAMADLVMWEGPAILGRRANPVSHNLYMAEFARMAQDLQMADQSMMQRSFSGYLAATKLPWPAGYLGSTFAQVHPALDSSVGVPFGGGDW